MCATSGGAGSPDLDRKLQEVGGWKNQCKWLKTRYYYYFLVTKYNSLKLFVLFSELPISPRHVFTVNFNIFPKSRWSSRENLQ